MLENFKKNIQDKIENNTYKSKLSWVSKSGEIHNETVLLKRSRLPLGDWGRIYPPINESGKINWINLIFGGKKHFIKLLIMLGIIALFIFGYYEAYQNYNALMENLCVQSCIGVVP